MSLRAGVFLCTVVSIGCGPSVGDEPPTFDASWLLGVYSLHLPTVTDALDPKNERYIFEADGTGAQQEISFERIVEERVLTWESESNDEVVARPTPFDDVRDTSYVLRPGSDCNTLQLFYLDPKGYLSETAAPLHRGEVCARQPDPEGTHDDYDRYWCDEPPPPCEGM